MKILITGGTERDFYLKEICREKGHVIQESFPCDLVVLPLPFSDTSIRDWDFPTGQSILCGITGENFDHQAKQRKWKLFRILQDERYKQENAWMTAEGALCTALNKMKSTLKESQCLVIGYGRIGKALTHLLRCFGAKTIVAARRTESRIEAGNDSIGINEIESVLNRTDLILNTVPSMVILETGLERVKKTAVLLELASNPYGFNMDAAHRLGLQASLESGIPGRLFPRSAANAVYRYIERVVLHE